MDRLNRIKMLFGDDAITRLHNATVMVVGVGAVGSFAAEALSRSGVGNIILIDSDVIEVSNINRQLFALDSTVGRPKVNVAADRIRDINPQIHTTALRLFFDENTNPDVKPDFVIDAIDSVPSKLALYRWCNKNGVPFISSMGAARKTDISQIKISRISKTSVCPLAAKIRKLLRDEQIPDFPVVFSTQPATPQIVPGKIFGSVITVTGTFGLYMAEYVIKHLIK